jgi:hypothetical protein
MVEVGGDHRRVGGAAHGQCGARAGVVGRVWVWRPAGCPRGRDRAVLGAILGLGAVLAHLCLPAGGGDFPACSCLALIAGCCRPTAAPILVLLQQSQGLLPVCAAVPREMEAGNPHAAISPKPYVP